MYGDNTRKKGQVPAMLFGAELDNQLGLHGDGDISGLRQTDDMPLGRISRHQGEELRHFMPRLRQVALNLLKALWPVLYTNDITGTYQITWDIDASPIHGKVSVTDQLAGLRPRQSEPEPADDIVQTALEEAHEDFTRIAM